MKSTLYCKHVSAFFLQIILNVIFYNFVTVDSPDRTISCSNTMFDTLCYRILNVKETNLHQHKLLSMAAIGDLDKQANKPLRTNQDTLYFHVDFQLLGERSAKRNQKKPKLVRKHVQLPTQVILSCHEK